MTLRCRALAALTLSRRQMLAILELHCGLVLLIAQHRPSATPWCSTSAPVQGERGGAR
jgi:hypothetical protein